MRLSCCGLDCDECEFRDLCKGCTKSTDGESLPADCERMWDGECDIRQCCMSKGFPDCSYCKEFPCDALVEFAFEDGMNEERLMLLKSEADKRQAAKEKIIRRFPFWITLGVLSGLIVGGVSGKALSWFISMAGGDYRSIDDTPVGMGTYIAAGVILGIAIPLIITIAENKISFKDLRKAVKRWLKLK